MTNRIFLRRVAQVEITDNSSEFPYSVVKKILSWETGSTVSGQGSRKAWDKRLGEKVLANDACQISPAGRSALAGVETCNQHSTGQGRGGLLHESRPAKAFINEKNVP
jgi:hypothetical protein